MFCVDVCRSSLLRVIVLDLLLLTLLCKIQTNNETRRGQGIIIASSRPFIVHVNQPAIQHYCRSPAAPSLTKMKRSLTSWPCAERRRHAVRVLLILALVVLTMDVTMDPTGQRARPYGTTKASRKEMSMLQLYDAATPDVSSQGLVTVDDDDDDDAVAIRDTGLHVGGKGTTTTTTNWTFPYDVQPHQIVITMCDNRWNIPNTTFLTLSSAINRAYAAHHGHRFLPCDTQALDQVPANQPHVGKLFCNLQALAMPNVRMVMYLDSDAVFRNFSQTLVDFIHQHLVVPKHAPDFDVIVPTDCSDYLYNTGIQIWKNTYTARQFLQTWIHFTLTDARMQRFPYEQKAFKLLLANNQYYPALNASSRIAYIPHAADTWHVGACARGRYRRAPAFVAHVAGKWRDARHSFLTSVVQDLCARKDSDFYLPKVAACADLLALVEDEESL